MSNFFQALAVPKLVLAGRLPAQQNATVRLVETGLLICLCQLIHLIPMQEYE